MYTIHHIYDILRVAKLPFSYSDFTAYRIISSIKMNIMYLTYTSEHT